jgi:hypothetical protein
VKLSRLDEGDGIAAIIQLNEHGTNGNHAPDGKNGNDVPAESPKEKDDPTVANDPAADV